MSERLINNSSLKLLCWDKAVFYVGSKLDERGDLIEKWELAGYTVPRQKFSPNRVISEKRVFLTLILLYFLSHHIMLRAPLALISDNRSRGPELHPHKRGFLLELNAGGATPSKIFKQYRVLIITTRLTITLISQRVNQASQP